METGLVILVALAMLVGLVGTIVSLVPGLPLVWGAALAFGLLTEFGTVGWVAFGVITVLLVVGVGAGIVLPHRRVASAGAPTSTVVAGVVLGVIGFFAVPVVGLPVGALCGVLVAERLRTASWPAARASTKSLLIGFGLAALVQLSAGLAMVLCWVAWVVFG